MRKKIAVTRPVNCQYLVSDMANTNCIHGVAIGKLQCHACPAIINNGGKMPGFVEEVVEEKQMAETKPVLYARNGWLYKINGGDYCVHGHVLGESACQACLVEIIAASNKVPSPREPRWVKVWFRPHGSINSNPELWQPPVANDVRRVEVDHIGAMYVLVTVGQEEKLISGMHSIVAIDANLPIVSRGHV